MKKIKLEIEISGLESWSTNWDNESSVSSALKEVKEEVRFAIRTRLGIQSSDIEITAEIDE